MTRKLPLGEGEAARTACAPGLLRAAVEEETGEVLSAAVLAERVGWAAGLVSGMAGTLTGAHWNAVDVDALASGEDAGGPPAALECVDGLAVSAGPSRHPPASASTTASCGWLRRQPGVPCGRLSGVLT